MKKYTITVNGTAYDVTVEENETGAAAAPAAPRPAAPAPAAKAAPAKAEVPASGTKGQYTVEAGAAGKVFKIEASVGQAVKKGDAVVVVEAMKMEIPMVAPADGTVASIDCQVGDSVEAGAVLATIS